MIFDDYLTPPRDLSGSWKFTVVYEDMALRAFKDFRVTYQVLLVQDGLKLLGHGEKLSDWDPGRDAVDYAGDRRTNVEVRRAVTRNYLSRDTLLLHYKEKGRRRDSTTVHRLVECGRGMLCGCFRSTNRGHHGIGPVGLSEGCDGCRSSAFAPSTTLSPCLKPRLREAL